MLLCGDIGGTKTTLALFAPRHPRAPVRLETYASTEVPGLERLLVRFLAGEPRAVAAACFGVAGPVRGGRVEATNIPWVIDAAALGAFLGGVPVFLLNDLEALAYGVDGLADADCVVLNAGRPEPGGTRAVIAAGTGLGQAALVWAGTRWIAVASEGGHADFAPRSEREIALLHYLQGRHEHVSWEHVVSGPGLVHLVEFLRDVEGREVQPALAAALPGPDGGRAVTTAALDGTAPVAAAALDLFVRLYGAEAGNLALKLKATGGVWVGGGIAPQILPRLQDGAFREAFVAKGRFRKLLEAVPVRVILEPRTALLGAAAYAESRPA
jgi:glucokinase